ncbi:hypothetical protein AB1Y20_017605 [Prymnesium parvum]|uniref:Uncharacterized protein n=1 Tax=Prymnesium parvum TaxID=97485 RepID=A0AB34JPJ5_PRYPA
MQTPRTGHISNLERARRKREALGRDGAFLTERSAESAGHMSGRHSSAKHGNKTSRTSAPSTPQQEDGANQHVEYVHCTTLHACLTAGEARHATPRRLEAELDDLHSRLPSQSLKYIRARTTPHYATQHQANDEAPVLRAPPPPPPPAVSAALAEAEAELKKEAERQAEAETVRKAEREAAIARSEARARAAEAEAAAQRREEEAAQSARAHARTAAQALAWATVQAQTEKEALARAEAAEAACRAVEDEKVQLLSALEEEAGRTRERLHAHAAAAAQACGRAEAEAAARLKAEARAEREVEARLEAERRAVEADERAVAAEEKAAVKHSELAREVDAARAELRRVEGELTLARRVCAEAQRERERESAAGERAVAMRAAAELALQHGRAARVAAEERVAQLEEEVSAWRVSHGELAAEVALAKTRLAAGIAEEERKAAQGAVEASARETSLTRRAEMAEMEVAQLRHDLEERQEMALGRRRDAATEPIEELRRTDQALTTKVEALLHELRVSEAQRERVAAQYAKLRDWCEGTGFECAVDDSEDESIEQPRAACHADATALDKVHEVMNRVLNAGGMAAVMSRRRQAKLEHTAGAAPAGRGGGDSYVRMVCDAAVRAVHTAPEGNSKKALRDWMWQARTAAWLYAEPPRLLVKMRRVLSDSFLRWNEFASASKAEKVYAVCKLQAQYRGNCARAIAERKQTLRLMILQGGADHGSIPPSPALGGQLHHGLHGRAKASPATAARGGTHESKINSRSFTRSSRAR